MALFKTNHFRVLSGVVCRVSDEVETARTVAPTDIEFVQLEMGHAILNVLVNDMVSELAKDNPLFNETVFRSECGMFISNVNSNEIPLESAE
jgi:hypothetical protein